MVEILSYLNFVYIGTFAAALDFFSDCKVKNVNEYWKILIEPIRKNKYSLATFRNSFEQLLQSCKLESRDV